MHPGTGDLSTYSDNELEERYFQLQKRYWQTSNAGVQMQITMLIEEYKLELQARRAKQKLNQQQDQENGNKGLDNLINVS